MKELPPEETLSNLPVKPKFREDGPYVRICDARCCHEKILRADDTAAGTILNFESVFCSRARTSIRKANTPERPCNYSLLQLPDLQRDWLMLSVFTVVRSVAPQ
jgi:hypothetical protein